MRLTPLRLRTHVPLLSGTSASMTPTSMTPTLQPVVRSRMLLVLALLLCSGCGTMRLYDQEPPLEFAAIDYGFDMQTSVINGLELAYHDSRGSGTPVVLIHGLASNAGFWRSNVPALEAAGFRVIAVDLPGYGKSAKPYSAPYGMRFYAETVAALLRHLSIPRAVWIGHSMGGQISMTAALHMPAVVDRLVLISPAGFETFKPGEGNWLRNAVKPDFIKRTTEDRVRANLTANFFHWKQEWEWMVEERARMARAADFDRFAYAVWRCVGAMLDEPVRAQLGRITAPTLVLGAENDNLIPNPYLHGGFTRDVMEDGARALANAHLVMLPETGHMAMIERADEVNRLVVEFINR